MNLTALSELKIGRSGIVEGLQLPDEIQHHLMHMGFMPEARVRAVRRAPTGDPTVYAVDGMEVALLGGWEQEHRVILARRHGYLHNLPYSEVGMYSRCLMSSL